MTLPPVADCFTCGRPFEPTLHQVKSAARVNCEGCRVCVACGQPRKAGPTPFGQRLCAPCRTVAWQTCWRKFASVQHPGRIVMDGVALHVLACRLCGKWHATRIPPDADLGEHYTARLAVLAAWVAATGFDIDAHRDRVYPPDATRARRPDNG